MPGSTSALRPNTTLDPCAGQHVTASEFQEFAEDVFRLPAWERGKPSRRVIQAERLKLQCAAGPGHRMAMKRRWRQLQAAYFEHRTHMLWLEEFKPFVYPDGTRWAVPYPIAWCESGGNYFVGPSGAYGLIPPFPQWLSPRRQDEIAHRLYEDQGEGPWAPYESGCMYR